MIPIQKVKIAIYKILVTKKFINVHVYRNVLIFPLSVVKFLIKANKTNYLHWKALKLNY